MSTVSRFAVCLLTLVGLLSAPSLGHAETNSPWYFRAWQSSDGLPDNSVTGVGQTSDGYLWVATLGGLMRFDGVRFQEFPLADVEGVPNRVVRAMLQDRRGRLWLGMDRGPVVCVAPGQTTVFTNVPDIHAICMADDDSDAIWITSEDGNVMRLQDGNIRLFDSTSGWPDNGTSSLASDARGQLWFARGRQAGVFRDGKFVTLATLNEPIWTIGRNRSGGIWICTGRSLMKIGEGGPAKTVADFPARFGSPEPRAVLEDHTGALWIGTAAHGLFRFDGSKVAVMPTSYFEITCLAEDEEGNIWAGTSGGGLNRVRPRFVELIGHDNGLPYESVRSVCEDSAGAIWVATQHGQLARWSDSAWTNPANGTNRLRGTFWCVAADAQGGVWIGSHDNGLFYLKGDSCSRWRRQDGMASDGIRSILVASDGAVYVASDGPSRVHRIRDGKVQILEMSVQPRSIRALVEDTNKTIWAGSADGVLQRVQGDQLVNVTPGVSNRLLSIRCLLATPDGALWIGYAGWGIGRLKDGKYSRITSEQGLYDDYVSQMVVDDRGALWCAGNRGVFRVPLARLNDVAEGSDSRVLCSVYGPDEGLANLQPNFENVSGAFRGRDGRLFFPMRTGLAIIHPGSARPSSRPPPVVLERVAMDGQTVALYDRRLVRNSERTAKLLQLHSSDQSLRLPPDHRDLQFEFTALSYTAPQEARFQYRLKGFNDNWAEPGAKRVATYSRLPPGRYQFDVRACNNDGVWNETGSSLAFVVAPFYWQTWWFRLAALAAFTLTVVSIVRYVSFRRLRDRLAVLEQHNVLQRERARIAKDIHDDLGASLTQIVFLGELAREDRGEPDKAGQRASKISSTARQAIKSLDEIVWAVNPRNDTLAHLIDYAGQFTLDYLRLAGVRCRLDLPEQNSPRELSTDLRHNLFLAIKEAVHNVVKHANASEVWLRIHLSEQTLDIAIEDNGCGFERQPDDALADGLRNMRQRMRDIGGQCEFESRPGGGTQVRFSLPWSRNGG